MFAHTENIETVILLRGKNALASVQRGGYNIFCQEGGRRYLPYAFTE